MQLESTEIIVTGSETGMQTNELRELLSGTGESGSFILRVAHSQSNTHGHFILC